MKKLGKGSIVLAAMLLLTPHWVHGYAVAQTTNTGAAKAQKDQQKAEKKQLKANEKADKAKANAAKQQQKALSAQDKANEDAAKAAKPQ